ncbi:apoptotic chromatin condensation inducer 1b [Syngnathus typhle]|uniref:apoptotic chromatin condensation inducer 1b n=1 Tax=Syngnathus typhle TaxID=161592 RepID=UPI002A6A92F9|nr:apoptotic chromatin condensation inducer 1b [Syngnathus typhle]
MADEDITLDGQPLQSLRVADLKAALEQRNLSKSGAKNKLIQRLKGALMLENLRGRRPNSQMGEEMTQNSFIQQYLAKQQELLSHRQERGAHLEGEADESPAMPEEDEDQSDNDSSSGVSDKKPPLASRSGEGEMSHKPDGSTGRQEAPAARMQRATFPQGRKEPPAPSPPRAVASLSVRVLGQPDRQGLPPALSRAQEKEGVAPSETASAHSVLHLSRSAGVSAGARVREDSDEDDDSGDDEDWGPGLGAARKGDRAPPQPPQMPASSVRSKRKLQPPQHIPPPQPQQNLMQLRHPTPPPSPPPDLFPLPDTPKQSPPDTDDKEGECSGARRGVPPRDAQRPDSDSRSRSSSPEPPAKRGPGPLSLLVHKMETEEAQTSAGAAAGQSPEESKKKEKQTSDRKEDAKAPDEEKLDGKKKAAAGDSRGAGGRDSGSSSDSDSRSDSSSKSSSSSSIRIQSCRVRQPKRAELRQDADKETKGTETQKGHLLKRVVSEPSEAAVSEVEPRSSGEARQPAPNAEPVDGEGRLEESTTPKAFAARKISLTSNKTPPVDSDGGAGDADAGAAGRKRRWGSSTAVTAKKPSISITTDSLKSLIPDIKIAQEAVVDLHPEELQLSGDDDNNNNRDNGQGDADDGLQIRRTVTQVVPSDQENGRGDKEENAETAEPEIPPAAPLVERSEQAPPEKTAEKLDGELKKACPDDALVRRSISRQRSGVSVTIDDPIRSARLPSPPRGKPSNIIHVTNLVRPFTLGQLKELLKQTGNMVEEGFWIDKIKSHCFVTYASAEEAAATRESLHGVKWPQSNPKVLSVDFCEQDEVDFHKGLLKPKPAEPQVPQPVPPPPSRPPPLMPERDRQREHEHERGPPGVRDLWAERQRQMERRERARGEREWDRDKIREFARPGADKIERRSRSRDRERRRRERPKSKEKKTEKKEKADEPPAKLLDDLFLKTKAAPCIYWLPLTEQQAAQRLVERSERQKERERRLKELQEEQEKVREERKKERLKARENESRGSDGNAPASARGAEAERDKERGRNKDGERRREGERRSGRPPLGRRSRSCSDTRDRRH